MLEVGDKHQPVVDPKVRDDVEHDNFRDSTLVRPETEDRERNQQANVRSNDLTPVLRLEDDRLGVEV